MSRFKARLKGIKKAKASKDKKFGNLKSSMRSSWIEYYEWIPNQIGKSVGDFFMKVKRGKRYRWGDISIDQAKQAIGGNATCITNDPTGRKRWTIGKHPSLGAAYHQVCKLFGKSTNSKDYSTIMEDIGYDKKKQYVKEGKGRPSKEYASWKRFSWTKKYKKRKTVGVI